MSRVMKKYVFEITYEVVEEIVVEANNYEEAEVKIEEGEGEVLNEEKYEWDFKCIKMPENLKEEEDFEEEWTTSIAIKDPNGDKWQKIKKQIREKNDD